MQATSSSTFGAVRRRRTVPIAVAVLAVATLAAAAALLDPGQDSGAERPAAGQSASGATVPAGNFGDPAVPGDPSVPSAASVFTERHVSPEEPPVTF